MATMAAAAIETSQVKIAPITFISISDQCTRLEIDEEENKLAIGGLLGEYITDRSGNDIGLRVVESLDLFTSDNIETWRNNLDVLTEIAQENYPEREFVGYFMAGPNVNITNPETFTLPITGGNPLPAGSESRTNHPPTLLLAWNTEQQGMAIKLHQINLNGVISNELQFVVDQEQEAEMIALSDVLTLESNRSSLTKLKRYKEGIENLTQRAGVLLQYLEDVENATVKRDVNILRGIKSLLSRLPLTSGNEFNEQLLEDYAQAQMYAFLGAMTEGSAMLAHNAKATRASQQKSQGGFGMSRGMGHHMFH